jgi:hypothetical protein
MPTHRMAALGLLLVGLLADPLARQQAAPQSSPAEVHDVGEGDE